jgi:hypothetical protein
MLRISLLLMIIGLLSAHQEKDSWEICQGKKTLVRRMEGDTPTALQINPTDTTALTIVFKEAPSNIQWKRNFSLRTENDSMLYQISFTYSSGKFRLPANQLNKIILRNGPVRLVTEQHPANDEIMARSKMTILAILQIK